MALVLWFQNVKETLGIFHLGLENWRENTARFWLNVSACAQDLMEDLGAFHPDICFLFNLGEDLTQKCHNNLMGTELPVVRTYIRAHGNHFMMEHFPVEKQSLSLKSELSLGLWCLG